MRIDAIEGFFETVSNDGANLIRFEKMRITKIHGTNLP